MNNTVNLQDLEAKAKEILLTLPKSFYLRTCSIDVELSTTAPTSFFSPDKFAIVVALNNIKLAIQNTKKLLTESELEFVLRGQLYHEISHAILTPTNLMQEAYKFSRAKNTLLNPYFANIIEDERIETVLKHNFYGVDFKKQLELLVEFVPMPQSFEHFVFNALRFRFSPVEKLRVKTLVLNFISRATSCQSEYSLCCYMEQLLRQLKSIYDAFVISQQQNNQPQNQGDGSQSSSSISEGNNCSSDTGSISSQDNEEDNQEDKSSSNTNSPKDSKSLKDEENDDEQESSASNEADDENAAEDESSSIEEELDEQDLNDDTGSLQENEIEGLVKQTLKNKSLMAGGNYGDEKLNNKLFVSRLSDRAKIEVAIAKNNGFGCKPKAPSSYGTCGKFSSRGYINDITNEKPSFKWFVRKVNDSKQKNGKTNVKTLNIWLDNSGSYSDNDAETNKVLKALCEIEARRSDFKFRLITFGSRFLEKFGDLRTSFSNQGTDLTGLKKEYLARNTTGKEYNIFLIDGDGNNMGEMACLNNRMTVIICDSEVVPYTQVYCRNAKEIIAVNDGSYPQRLAENVIKAFERLF